MSETSLTPRKVILTFFLLDGTVLRPLQMLLQFDNTETVGPMCRSIEEKFFPSSRKGYVKVLKPSTPYSSNTTGLRKFREEFEQKPDLLTSWVDIARDPETFSMSLELALDWSTESHRGNPMALVAQTLDTAAPLPADIRPSTREDLFKLSSQTPLSALCKPQRYREFQSRPRPLLHHLRGNFDEPLFGITSNNNFNFPLATCYLREDGEKVKFKYLERLKESDRSCAIFKVQVVNDGDDSGDEEESTDDEAEPTDDEENSSNKEDKTSNGLGSYNTVDKSSILVVKFVQRYGVEAHQALATAHLAPHLHYYGSIWPEIPDATPWRMVVMEFLEGRMLSEESSYSPAICEAIRNAVKLLHEQGLVHGDLRAPNIIVMPTANGHAARIVDFDWAGKNGEVKYPHDVNLHAKLGWARGVRPLGLIEPKHDMHMIKRYKPDSTV